MVMVFGSRVAVRHIIRVALCGIFSCVAGDAFAQQQTPIFTPGNLVVLVEGCGVNGGTCTSVPSGTGTGTGNSSNTGYGDNQAAPITLFQYKPSTTASATFVNSLVLPQTGLGANLGVSGEYGSSSEGGLQLSGQGQYLTLGSYGINAAVFNAATATNYGDTTTTPALAQTGSLTGQSYTPVARVATFVDAYGNVNTSTAVFNIFNTNNPRSVYSANGTTAYMSGQGTGNDATGGVFYLPQTGATVNAPTAITGLDTSTNTVSEDTRFVTVNNNTLYVSSDSKAGSGGARSFVGTLGTPPATSTFNSSAGPTQLVSTSNGSSTVVSKTGAITLTASETNGINATGQNVNLSPSGYYFANASTLYIADTGNGKQNSGTSTPRYGAGGLQKWVNSATDGSGTWVFQYNLYKGLNLVANPVAVTSNTSGTTGVYAVAGVVSGSNVYLYVTNATIADLDTTYLYGITDVLAATTNPNPSNTFALLATAPADSNFKGVSFAPTLPAGSATINTAPEGLQVTTAGTGCLPGTYTTPVTLVWTPGSSCQLSVVSSQTAGGTSYLFAQWQDATTATTDAVTAPSAAAVYTATFDTKKLVFTAAPTTPVTAGGNAGTVTVSLEDLSNNVLTADSSTVVTLKATGPSAAQTYTATAASGVATFNLATPALTGAGTYTYTATGAALVQAQATETVSAGQAVAFGVTGLGTYTAPQQTQTAMVAALDSYGNTVTAGSFTGTVTVTTTDATATVSPVSYTYTASDAGVHGFAVMFNTSGTYTVTASSGSIVGSESGVVVQDSIFIVNANGTLVRATDAGAQGASAGSAAGTSSTGGVASDNAGDIWVVENANGNVQEYSRTGSILSVSGSAAAGVMAPAGIAVDGLGNVWVTNGSNAVSQLSNAGAAVSPSTGYTGVTTSSSGGTTGYTMPTGIAFDLSGNVWVSNSGNNTVTEILGAAAPLAPLATGAASNTTGVRP